MRSTPTTTARPSSILTSTTADATPTSLWSNVVAVRLHMLMRSTEAAVRRPRPASTTSARCIRRETCPAGFKCRLVTTTMRTEQRRRTAGELRCRAHFSQSAQQGSALVISIFFLLLLATLALTGLRASTTNVQIVGNMQARQEVTAAAQMLLEQTLSTDEFARNPQGVFAAARVERTSTATASATPSPCLRKRRCVSGSIGGAGRS